MFRARAARFFLVASIVSLVSLWLFALAGLANPLGLPVPGESGPRAGSNVVGLRTVHSSGAEDTQGGVTIRVVEGQFSSSETHLLLEFTGLPSGLSLSQFSLETALQIDGILGQADNRLSESAPPSEDGNPRSRLILGPVADVSQPLTLSFSYTGQALGALQPGSAWRISFIPGPGARDPVDKFVSLERTVDYGPVTVSVKGVHISSSQVSVFYDMTQKAGFSADPVDGSIARLVYGDGEEIAGASTLQLIEVLEDGSARPKFRAARANAPYAVTFPMLRRPDEPFTIRFGDLTVGEPGAQKYVLPIDGSPVSVESDNNRFELSEHVDSGGRLVIAVKRVTDTGPGAFLVASPNKASLADDLGNSYRFVGGEQGFRKTPAGEVVADRTIMRFSGPLAGGAHELILAVRDSAQVLGPLSGGDIAIQ